MQKRLKQKEAHRTTVSAACTEAKGNKRTGMETHDCGMYKKTEITQPASQNIQTDELDMISTYIMQDPLKSERQSHDLDMANDFDIIFARTNSKNYNCSWKWCRHHAAGLQNSSNTRQEHQHTSTPACPVVVDYTCGQIRHQVWHGMTQHGGEREPN